MQKNQRKTTTVKRQSNNPNGRPAGSRNKATAKREAEIRASGLTPLDYMLKTLRNEKADPVLRMEAAKAAAPYVHPKLSSVTVGGDQAAPIRLESLSLDQLLKLGERLEKTLGGLIG